LIVGTRSKHTLVQYLYLKVQLPLWCFATGAVAPFQSPLKATNALESFFLIVSSLSDALHMAVCTFMTLFLLEEYPSHQDDRRLYIISVVVGVLVPSAIVTIAAIRNDDATPIMNDDGPPICGNTTTTKQCPCTMQYNVYYSAYAIAYSFLLVFTLYKKLRCSYWAPLCNGKSSRASTWEMGGDHSGLKSRIAQRPVDLLLWPQSVVYLTYIIGAIMQRVDPDLTLVQLASFMDNMLYPMLLVVTVNRDSAFWNAGAKLIEAAELDAILPKGSAEQMLQYVVTPAAWHGEGETCGLGAEGEVAIVHLVDGPLVAKKKSHDRGLAGLRSILQEAGVLSTLHHNNIVQLAGLCVFPGEVSFLMESCECNISQLLLDPRQPQRKPPLDMRLHLAAQCAAGMAAIEEAFLLHRDLKCENALISSHGVVKICDFGRSRVQGRRMSVLPGTSGFAAPETFEDGVEDELNVYGPASDVYSWGHILYSCMTCKVETPRVELPSQGGHYARGGRYVGPKVTLRQLCDLVIGDGDASATEAYSIPTDVASNGTKGEMESSTEETPRRVRLLELHELLTECFKMDSLQRPSFKEICTRMARLTPLSPEDGLELCIRDARVCELQACVNPSQQFKVAGVLKLWLLPQQ